MSEAIGKRAPNKWTARRLRDELEEFLDGATEWPSYRDFQRAGRQTLRNQVTRFGGARLWAKRLGSITRNASPDTSPVGPTSAFAQSSPCICAAVACGRAVSSSRRRDVSRCATRSDGWRSRALGGRVRAATPESPIGIEARLDAGADRV